MNDDLKETGELSPIVPGVLCWATETVWAIPIVEYIDPDLPMKNNFAAIPPFKPLVFLPAEPGYPTLKKFLCEEQIYLYFGSLTRFVKCDFEVFEKRIPKER